MKKTIVFPLILFSIFNCHLSFADSLQVYFNHNKDHHYQDPYYKRNRIGDNLENVLLDAINNAKKSISIAVYELDLPNVARALAQKKLGGIVIKIVLENTNSKLWRPLNADELNKLDEHALGKYKEFFAFTDSNHDGIVSEHEITHTDSLHVLKDNNIAWIDDTSDGSQGSGLMHHKFMIVDGSLLITGSANFTRSCIHGDFLNPNSKGNANSMLRIENKEIIDLFQNEFDELWINHHFGLKKQYRGPHTFQINDSTITVQFSPTSKKYGWPASTNGLIVKQFDSAKSSSDLALFVFSEQKIVDAIQAAHEQGMENRTLIDPNFATRYYSELLDILGIQMRNSKCSYEEGNNSWIHPALQSGFALLDKGDVLHHKFAVIDHHKTITGSHNWSASANLQNDEALLIIDDIKIANEYSKEFENLIQYSVLGIPAWLTRKISDLNQKCNRQDTSHVSNILSDR